MKFKDLLVGSKFTLSEGVTVYQKVSTEKFIGPPNYLNKRNWSSVANADWEIKRLPDERLKKWLKN